MDADVIVVGAGPSGLVVANELRVQGCSVLVLERREHGVQSRAGTVLPRVLELLDYRGHAQAFIDRARAGGDEPLVPFHAWGGMSPIRWNLVGGAFPYRLVVPQSDTEELLLGIGEDAGVQIRRGETVTALTQDETQATVTTTSSAGQERTYTSRYVVGADGGRSAVRTLAGIDFPGHDGTFTGMIADVRGELHWPGGRGIASNQRGWAMAFPFAEGGKVTRFNIVHTERRTVDAKEPVTLEEIRQCAEDIFDRELTIDHVDWASRFDDTMRQADRLREGRVLLVGESARVHYPASGVGMNFCIQDAFNLGWKLGQVVRGDAAEAFLDTYEGERRPVADRLLESVEAQLAIQFNFTEQGAALRTLFQGDVMPLPEINRTLALQLLGLTDAYPTVEGSHRLEGRPFPEASVHTVDGLYRVASLLTEGTFVLLDLSRSDVFPQELRSTHVVRGSFSNPSAALEGVTALLIRPDGYVHWASSDRHPDSAAMLAALDNLLDGHTQARSTSNPAVESLTW